MIYFLQNEEPMAKNTIGNYKNQSINHYNIYNPRGFDDQLIKRMETERNEEEEMLDYWSKSNFRADFTYKFSNTGVENDFKSKDLEMRRNYVRSKYDNNPNWSYLDFNTTEKINLPKINMSSGEVGRFYNKMLTPVQVMRIPVIKERKLLNNLNLPPFPKVDKIPHKEPIPIEYTQNEKIVHYIETKTPNPQTNMLININ